MTTSAAAQAKAQERIDEVGQLLERPYRYLDFVVYRFMQPADKRGILYNELVGGGLAGSKVWVNDFNPLWGEFLLDLGEPVHDVQDYRPLVTRMEGYGLDQGRVKYRSLQQIQFPWGIDGSLPVQIWANELFRDDHRLPFDPTGMNRLDLQWECRRRELSTKGKRSVLIQRINNIELTRGRPEADKAAAQEAVRRLDSVTLPLHRVLRNLPAVPKSRELPFKQPPFRAGEVVLVYGTLASDANICLVRDYEGNRGRLGREDLDEIELAFGLKLNRRALVEILDRLAWPDEEDAEPKPITNNPELQAEHVQRYMPQWTDAANAEAKARRQREKESEQRFEDEIAADNVSDVASDKAAEKEQERKRKEAAVALEATRSATGGGVSGTAGAKPTSSTERMEQEKKRKETAAAAKAIIMKWGEASGVIERAQIIEAEIKKIRAVAKANVIAWAADEDEPEGTAGAMPTSSTERIEQESKRKETAAAAKAAVMKWGGASGVIEGAQITEAEIKKIRAAAKANVIAWAADEDEPEGTAGATPTSSTERIEQESKRKETAVAAKAAVMKWDGASGVIEGVQVAEAEMKKIRAVAKANVAAWAADKGGPEGAAASAEKRKAGMIVDTVASMQHPGGPKRPHPGGGGQGGTSKKPKI